jgi:hypothetical protein
MAEDSAQLSWEKRFAPWAAGAALGAVVFQVAGFVVGISANKGAPGRSDPLPIQRTLENFHAHANALLSSQIIQSVGNFFAAGVLYYLFRATRHRRKELPAVVQWLLAIGPVLLLVAVIFYWSGTKTAADKFANPVTVAHVNAKQPTKDERKDGREFCKKNRKTSSASCVNHYGQREAVAKKLADDNRSPLTAAAGFGGTLSFAFAYVIIALNAMRAGLLSRFMGILGIIVGALMVLPILPSPVVQIFWLGALGLLFLGRWAGGRGPAWETGQAEPWPVPEGRGGLFAPRPRAEPEPEPEPQPGPEPVDRPPSRKRRRKKKR